MGRKRTSAFGPETRPHLTIGLLAGAPLRAGDTGGVSALPAWKRRFGVHSEASWGAPKRVAHSSGLAACDQDQGRRLRKRLSARRIPRLVRRPAKAMNRERPSADREQGACWSPGLLVHGFAPGAQRDEGRAAADQERRDQNDGLRSRARPRKRGGPVARRQGNTPPAPTAALTIWLNAPGRWGRPSGRRAGWQAAILARWGEGWAAFRPAASIGVIPSLGVR